MGRFKPEIHPDPMPEDLVEEMGQWIDRASGAKGVAKLIRCLERRYWVAHRTICPTNRWEIPSDLIERMRRRVAHIVRREFNGQWPSNGFVVRSNGSRFWTELGGKYPKGGV